MSYITGIVNHATKNKIVKLLILNYSVEGHTSEVEGDPKEKKRAISC